MDINERKEIAKYVMEDRKRLKLALEIADSRDDIAKSILEKFETELKSEIQRRSQSELWICGSFSKNFPANGIEIRFSKKHWLEEPRQTENYPLTLQAESGGGRKLFFGFYKTSICRLSANPDLSLQISESLKKDFGGVIPSDNKWAYWIYLKEIPSLREFFNLDTPALLRLLESETAALFAQEFVRMADIVDKAANSNRR